MSRKPWNILLDFDGTLHDTETIFSSKLDGLFGLDGKTLYALYLSEIHRKLVHEHFPERHNDRRFHCELFCRHLKKPIDNELICLLENRFKEAEEIIFSSPRFFKDARAFLDMAICNGYRLCLSTGGGNSMAKAKTIQKFFGRNYFEDIIGEETLNHLKDDPLYYEEALKRLSWESEQVVSIGDSIQTDIYPAKLVGIKTIWVNRKNGTQTIEMDKAPDYSANDLISTMDYLTLKFPNQSVIGKNSKIIF